MAEATIRYNPDRSLCEVQIGTSEQDTWGPLDADDSGHFLVDEESGDLYYLALGDEEGLTPDTLYRMEPVETDTEDGVEIESDEEDNDDPEETANGAH